MAQVSLPKEIPVLLQTLELGPDGSLTLPATFRAALGLEGGGRCTVLQLDGIVLLVSRPLLSPEALEGMRQALNTAGVTLDDLLAGLADMRTQIVGLGQLTCALTSGPDAV